MQELVDRLVCLWKTILSLFKKPRLNKFGWKKDQPDDRDFVWVSSFEGTLPSKIDWRSGCPSIYDQGQLGSCTANAAGGSCEYEMIQNKLPVWHPSRLYIYYNTRKIQGTTSYDSGASIRDTFKSLATYGFCNETVWPYNISKFRKKPSTAAYNAAAANKLTSIQYMRVNQTEQDLKACLASGNLVVFGFSVYSSFESDTVARTGVMPMPKKGEKVLGGHAVVLVGYDDSTRRYIVRNSWGTGWGMKGYFTMPYDFAHNPNYASDFWCLKTIPGGTK